MSKVSSTEVRRCLLHKRNVKFLSTPPSHTSLEMSAHNALIYLFGMYVRPDFEPLSQFLSFFTQSRVKKLHEINFMTWKKSGSLRVIVLSGATLDLNIDLFEYDK